MRILKFIGAFLGTLILVFFLAFGFSLDSLFTLFENRESLQEGQEWVAKTSSLKGLAEYIGAQPEHVSIVSLNLTHPDSSISYNGHTPRTMGRLSNIFLAIHYARQVAAGKLDPDRQIPLDEVNKYQLPYMDYSSHTNALAALEDAGEISDKGTVSLSSLMQIAIQYHDLAVSDFLLFYFEPQNIEHLVNELGLLETESLLPFSGLYITLHPGIYGRSIEQHADSLSRMSRTEFETMVWENARNFANDPGFHSKVEEVFESNNGLGITFTQQRDLLDFFPKTTSQDMAGLMKRIQQNELFSKEISQEIKSLMNWPMNVSRLQRDLSSYGAIYDNRLGMANALSFGVSAYGKSPFVQAIFFDNLPVAFWFHMSSNLMHQDYARRLIWDPQLRKATRQEISANR
jgi:hypothetical protein